MVSTPSPQNAGLLFSGRYTLVKKLGAGSLGTVYLAEDLSAKRRVALKVLRSDRLESAGLERLKSEFQAIASLRHPQIAAAYDFGYTEPVSGSTRIPYYTREYVPGTPLPPGPPRSVDLAEFLRPIDELLDALAYLHSHDILHLDIHSGNLIVPVKPDRGAVLIDVGLVGPASAPFSSALFNSHIGVPPELLAGAPLSARSDIYSVGRLLVYRLTGESLGGERLPREIPGCTDRQTRELERIIAKAMQRDPMQRFGSAEELRDALRRAVGSESAAGPASANADSVEPSETLFGREVELGLIDSALRKARAGSPRALWLIGGHGIGKSRLLTEARWRSQLQGFEVVTVRFRSHQGAPGTLADAARGVAEDAAWLSPLSTEHGGSTPERARKAAQALVRSNGAPVVFVLDDLDHADRESHLLAAAILAETENGSGSRGVAIFVSSRQHPKAPQLASISTGAARALRPLGKRVSRELFARCLRPLDPPAALVARGVDECEGNPLRLRQLARALRAEYGNSGAIPSDAVLPRFRLRAASASDDPVELVSAPDELAALRVLAVLGRPARADELAAACELSVARMRAVVRTLERAELISSSVRGRRRMFSLDDPQWNATLGGTTAESEARTIHARVARHLGDLKQPRLHDRESRVRSLLSAGELRAGRAEADVVARTLAERGHLDAAAQLLERVLQHSTTPTTRLELAEAISEMRALAGDHVEGLAVLEPAYRAVDDQLAGRDRVRVERRLGVHYHRAGQPAQAVEVFQRALAAADAQRDREELLFVQSELAELHTFRGEYDAAERACEEGLRLLAAAPTGSGSPSPLMEVTLRASLGHLELRRMRFDRARDEFVAALRLAQSGSTTTQRALILNNLGVLYNQRSEFAAAERSFRAAEKLQAAAGERGDLIQTACNLALISAKLGDADAADADMRRARQLVREKPGERLAFTAAISGAFKDHLFGAFESALDALRDAIPLGKKLGDRYLVQFATVYLAEAQIGCARYADARRTLARAAREAKTNAPPIVARMVATRLLVLDSLLGRPRAARRARSDLDAFPRTDLELPEAWNDLFLAFADAPRSEATRIEPERALRTFARLGVKAGERFVRVAFLYAAMRENRATRVRSILLSIERDEPSSHHLLAVLEPLARGEACLFLGEFERSDAALDEAAAAIVGEPFLELDWRIEYLRARVADRRGDREAARHRLHRGLQAQDLIVRALPTEWRRSFLAHPRFAGLNELRERLETTQEPVHAPGKPGEVFPGFIGTAAPIVELFATLRRLQSIDSPILIRGETGTGKEMIARIIHETSGRRGGPFYSVHAAALPAELFETELFGYERGAFTGADESRPGLLDHLRGGTLLIDDVSLLAPETQIKVLRVLESGVVRPVGAVETHPIDVRFLASTHVDSREMLETGLREDLYYRLGAFEVELPPLRERAEDIGALFRHFLEKHARKTGEHAPTVSSEAIDRLREYNWPGNVRELETAAVRVLFAASPGAHVTQADVEQWIDLGDRRATAASEACELPESWLEGKELSELRIELERAYILKAFRESGGDIDQLMARLGVKRSNLYTWLRRVGLDIRAMRRDL